MKKTVVVGMSGGVDSAVAAKLLKDSNEYNVIGLFMHNWEEEDENSGACTSANDWKDVQLVCGRLDIPCYSVNFSKEYMERVFSYFLEEYKKGRTPNPDVLCNREIKFGPFREFAKKLGADKIATGHYCAVKEGTGGAELFMPLDKEKDQTYFLNQVRTEQLTDVIFPLCNIKKPQVREIALAAKLDVASKKDSTGICFIGERNFKTFLKTYLPAMHGKIVDTSGKEIGEHDGLMYYTIGQRRGLGIGGVKDEKQSRWYVIEKNLELNRLIVSCGEGEELFYSSLTAENMNFIGEKPTKTVFDCEVKSRYRQPCQNATVTLLENNRIKVDFKTAQRAITAGQYVVLYEGERCLGGGVIE